MGTAAYAFAHFAVDLGCAFAVFSAGGSAEDFLLYNFFAFAVQMPLGLLADLWGRNRLFALIGTLCTALLCCFPLPSAAGFCLLGLGNALFHIGGGLDTMHAASGKAAPLGVFVSPGALGVYLGTILAKQGISPVPVIAILLLACGLMLIFRGTPHTKPPVSLPGRQILLPATLLFGVVILRSYGGMTAAFPWKTDDFVLLSVLAVSLGKALGGVLSDRFGMKPVACGSLLLSGALLLFPHATTGLIALLLFNMTMPITLHALSRQMPGMKGFSFGLLTFALFLGFLPSYFGAPAISSAALTVVCLLSLALLLPALKAGDRA